MKTLITTLCLSLTSQTFAFDLCSYQQTSDLKIKASSVSKNMKKFSFEEKNLVYRTLSLENFSEGLSKPRALEIFQEWSNDGEIVYYKVKGRELILVHYWPGDNEAGAFYEILPPKKMAKLVATVGDSFISCIRE